MALIFNNLLLNKNSKKYTPFLFNLISGRRKMLRDVEMNIITTMISKQSILNFNGEERALYNKLKIEKQFIDDDERHQIEQKMIENRCFELDNPYTNDFTFTIQATQDCNMSCAYCFENDYKDERKYLSKEHIDAIAEFYNLYTAKQDIDPTPPFIRITGGEPLLNLRTVELVNYIASKWNSSKLIIITNGVNILQYYNKLPLGQIDEIIISLDGVKSTHLSRRYTFSRPKDGVYENIILGVKKLLKDKVSVVINTALDRNNYSEYYEFKNYLIEEEIATSQHFTHSFGSVMDMSNKFDLDEDFNDINDIFEMKDYFSSTEHYRHPILLSLEKLSSAIYRPKNKPFSPQHMYCNTRILSKCYFSCNGRVYFCECWDEKKGIIGEYFPNISLDEKAVLELANRSIMNNNNCAKCAYKFVCLGSCPKSAEAKGLEMSCGIFDNDYILDNLEFNYF